MNTDYLNRMMSFTEANLPTLDEVVMGALVYLEALELPTVRVNKHTRPLVVGSGNALQTGKILFRGTDAVFVEEGNFSETIARGYYDAVYIVSASGSKHARSLAEEAVTSGIPVYLITSTADSPASVFLPKEHTFVYPHIREPYTYNTSTYLAMLYGNSEVSPERVRTHIETVVLPLMTDFAPYRAFLFTVPTEFADIRSMYETKFDELFGPYVLGRGVTTESIKHAKTVITAPDQCFISLGEDTGYGSPGLRIGIPLPEKATPGEVIAIGYYIIGRIQASHPPYFKECIGAYMKETSRMFGHTIPVIVE